MLQTTTTANPQAGDIGEIIKCRHEKIQEAKNKAKVVVAGLKACEQRNLLEYKLIDSFQILVILGSEISQTYNTVCLTENHMGVVCSKEMATQVVAFQKKVEEVNPRLLKGSSYVSDCVWNSIKDVTDYFLDFPSRLATCNIHFFSN